MAIIYFVHQFCAVNNFESNHYSRAAFISCTQILHWCGREWSSIGWLLITRQIRKLTGCQWLAYIIFFFGVCFACASSRQVFMCAHSTQIFAGPTMATQKFQTPDSMYNILVGRLTWVASLTLTTRRPSSEPSTWTTWAQTYKIVATWQS